MFFTSYQASAFVYKRISTFFIGIQVSPVEIQKTLPSQNNEHVRLLKMEKWFRVLYCSVDSTCLGRDQNHKLTISSELLFSEARPNL